MKLADVVPADLQDAVLVAPAKVAGWLGVGIHTIYNWSRKGRLPPLKRLGRRTVRFNVGELRVALRKLDRTGAPSAKE